MSASANRSCFRELERERDAGAIVLLGQDLRAEPSRAVAVTFATRSDASWIAWNQAVLAAAGASGRWARGGRRGRARSRRAESGRSSSPPRLIVEGPGDWRRW